MIMADRMITTYLEERKYDALKRALNEKGEDFEDTMHDLVETCYETTVPMDEQERIEKQIEEDLLDEQADDIQEDCAQTDEEDAPVMQM